jgi:hypothetical protein
VNDGRRAELWAEIAALGGEIAALRAGMTGALREFEQRITIRPGILRAVKFFA